MFGFPVRIIIIIKTTTTKTIIIIIIINTGGENASHDDITFFDGLGVTYNMLYRYICMVILLYRAITLVTSNKCPVPSALTLTRFIRTLHFIRVTIIEYNLIL